MSLNVSLNHIKKLKSVSYLQLYKSEPPGFSSVWIPGCATRNENEEQPPILNGKIHENCKIKQEASNRD